MKLCVVNNNKKDTFIIATLFVKYKIASRRPTRFVLTSLLDDDHLQSAGARHTVSFFLRR